MAARVSDRDSRRAPAGVVTFGSEMTISGSPSSQVRSLLRHNDTTGEQHDGQNDKQKTHGGSILSAHLLIS